VTVTTAKGAQELSFMDLPHVHQPLVQRITDTLRGRDHLEDTGLSALRTQAVLEALATGEPLQGEND
jgi:glutamyl/glutaminyl-tRNA synthetase